MIASRSGSTRVASAYRCLLYLGGAVSLPLGIAAIVLISRSGGQAQPIPTHPVLFSQLTTTTFSGGLPSHALTVRLWTDPVRAVAVLTVPSLGATVYYRRTDGGRWLMVGRATPEAPWTRRTVAASVAPALTTLPELRALDTGLLQQAGRRAFSVGLHTRAALTFPASALRWPFRYSGPATVWIDRVTALPLRFRTVAAARHQTLTTITTIDDLREYSSRTLPTTFFSAP